MTREERFWAKVNKDGPAPELLPELGPCWLWTASKNPKGYGMFSYAGKGRGAHRVAYEWEYGNIPAGMLLDHRCHVRHCIRPTHLRLATTKQNAENRKGADKGNKSGVRGVTWHPATGKWQAVVGHHGKLHYLGVFATINEADEVVQAKRLELFTHL